MFDRIKTIRRLDKLKKELDEKAERDAAVIKELRFVLGIRTALLKKGIMQHEMPTLKLERECFPKSSKADVVSMYGVNIEWVGDEQA